MVVRTHNHLARPAHSLEYAPVVGLEIYCAVKDMLLGAGSHPAPILKVHGDIWHFEVGEIDRIVGTIDKVPAAADTVPCVWSFLAKNGAVAKENVVAHDQLGVRVERRGKCLVD